MSFFKRYFAYDNNPKSLIHFFILIIYRLFRDKKKRGISEVIIKYSRYFVKDKKNNKLFSVRNFGGSTKSRAKNFYDKEPDTIAWISNFDVNSNFLDVGANIGIYSLFAGMNNHKVISIEPEALNFAILNLNINDNSLNNKRARKSFIST